MSHKKYSSLVTGGAGFIGAHLSTDLHNLNHQVVVLDDLSGGFVENLPNTCTFVHGSINDIDLLEQLFRQYRFDYVYHLAAYAAEGLSHFIRRYNYQNNVMGSINLINLAIQHHVKCFVFTSSIAIYGTNVLPMVETATPKPEDPYGIAKYAIELDLQAAKHFFGLNYIIFRPHNVYGPLQNIGDKYRNVIGIFMNQLLQAKPLTIYGNGQQTRAFTSINDVAPHIAKAVHLPEAYNQVFNIGSDKQYTVNELAEAVMTAMQLRTELKYLAARKEVVHAYANHDKFYQVFGINTANTTSLKDGLQAMAQWVCNNGSRSTPPFKNIEIKRNLPTNWQ